MRCRRRGTRRRAPAASSWRTSRRPTGRDQSGCVTTIRSTPAQPWPSDTSSIATSWSRRASSKSSAATGRRRSTGAARPRRAGSRRVPVARARRVWPLAARSRRHPQHLQVGQGHGGPVHLRRGARHHEHGRRRATLDSPLLHRRPSARGRCASTASARSSAASRGKQKRGGRRAGRRCPSSSGMSALPAPAPREEASRLPRRRRARGRRAQSPCRHRRRRRRACRLWR